jgi:hypothetical protein
MKSVLQRRRDKLFALGVRMQPVVVVLGQLTAPTAAYVVVDETTWQLSSPLKAVDICFKTYHVLHAAYPSESHYWLLLQQLVFDIHTKWDVRAATVSTVLCDLLN